MHKTFLLQICRLQIEIHRACNASLTEHVKAYEKMEHFGLIFQMQKMAYACLLKIQSRDLTNDNSRIE